MLFNAANARLFNGAQRLDEGTSFVLTSGLFTQQFQITYAGGTNANDIVLIAVPEQGVFGELLGGLGICVDCRAGTGRFWRTPWRSRHAGRFTAF